MTKYPLMVSGLFDTRESADMARQVLLKELPDQVHCRVLLPEDSEDTIYKVLQPEVRAIRDSLVGDTVLGSSISGEPGAPGRGGPIGAGIPLVVASPVAATLWGLGHGSMLGGIDGASKAFRIKDSDHHTLVKAALHNGAHAVIAHVLDVAAVDVAYACLLRSVESIGHTA